jgi:RNA-directed DNA polymerase
MLMKIENVMKRVYEPMRLKEAWHQVRKNAGSAGIDRITVEDFERRIKELAPIIVKKLKEGKYRFKPARRVYIKKENSNKLRPLGIPVVMDRIVSQSMNTVLQEVFDHTFTETNYGFRPGKSQAMAVKELQSYVQEGYKWCASIDLKSFFDEIPHNLILKLLRRGISDEGFITLIARALKSGVVIDGKFEKTTKGCPQGSPVSPILSNIVLNELDQELERRRLKFVRWADDFVIVCKSERAAKRILESITNYLELELKLPVNKEKSVAVKVHEITFLGFQISSTKRIKISGKAIKKFNDRVRLMTKRNNPKSMYQIVKELNRFLAGWVNYFKIQEYVKPFKEIDQWIRNRLRSMQLKKWKKPKRLQKMMIKEGLNPDIAKRTWVKMKKWKSIRRKEVMITLGLSWFRKLGVIFLEDYTLTSCESVV